MIATEANRVFVWRYLKVDKLSKILCYREKVEIKLNEIVMISETRRYITFYYWLSEILRDTVNERYSTGSLS